MKNLKLLTPFPNKFYWWWTKHNSKTLFGENIFSQLDVTMTNEDWKEVFFFQKGVSLTSMVSLRNHDQKTADWGFSKSCLFATIATLALIGKFQTFLYEEAVVNGGQEFKQFEAHIKLAYSVRKGVAHVQEANIFSNFKYFQYLESEEIIKLSV